MPHKPSLYTRLLKQKKVSRKEINKAKNSDKKRAIIRELLQDYNQQELSRTQTLKLIRKHGIKIPKDIADNPFEFAGIKRFGQKETGHNRKLTTRIQKLKGSTIPKENQMFASKSFNKGEYVYILEYKAGSKKKTALIMSDIPVSRNRIEKVIGDMIRTGEFDDESFLFLDSPPLRDININDITSYRVVGLMRGTA